MGIKDLFKKKDKTEAEIVSKNSGDGEGVKSSKKKNTKDAMGGMNFNDMLSQVDTSSMSTMQKMGMKMFQKLPQKKQQEILRQAMNPAEIMKNKDKVLGQIDDMVKSGMIDKGQAEAVKAKMGLR